MNNIYAWAAGFLDADGTLTIKRVHSRKHWIYHQPYISCTQSLPNIRAITKLKELFGGSIGKPVTAKSSFMNRQPTVSWCIASRKAEDCAKKILPFMVLKKENCEIIAKFFDTTLKREKQYRLTEDDIAKREDLFWQIRELNVKGKIRLKRLSETAPHMKTSRIEEMRQSEHGK